jgi:cell division protein FtsL
MKGKKFPPINYQSVDSQKNSNNVEQDTTPTVKKKLVQIEPTVEKILGRKGFFVNFCIFVSLSIVHRKYKEGET